MTAHQQISIEDYSYELPLERIAHYPLAQRDSSKLLIYQNENIVQDRFSEISKHLPAHSLIIFNNTRVVQARLLFRKDTGALIEIFCLEPAGAIRDVQLAFQDKGKSDWFCLVGNAKKWKQGPLQLSTCEGIKLIAHKGESRADGFIVHFSWDQQNLSFAEVLDQAGKTPLPPYISRKAEDKDKDRYQTIFAEHAGSVAAPTAGLHFSQEVMESLQARDIQKTYVTLHVGAGTFKPVSAPTMAGHQMHHEQIIVEKESIKNFINHAKNPVICVGTTSLRTMESLYWLGVKVGTGYSFGKEGFRIAQWEPYDYLPQAPITFEQAMQNLLKYLEQHHLDYLHGETSLLIVPGYQIQSASILITNFHQPRSTLLLLVAAFCGEGWRRIYTHALRHDFRFLSYGDSCLLFRHP